MESDHPIYNSWAGMLDRCRRPNNREYHRYGGRGIKVCDEWQQYIPFAIWARENGWEEGLTIDRIDNDGNYSPENCRWITGAENARRGNTGPYTPKAAGTMNEEFNRFVIHCGGNTKTSEVLGCKPDMIRKMKTGERGIREKYIQIMYRHRGFRLSFLRLFNLA